MQVISSLVRPAPDREFREELNLAIRQELVAFAMPEQRRRIGWLQRMAVLRPQSAEYQWLLVGSLLMLFVLPTVVIVAAGIRRSETLAVVSELQELLAIAPALSLLLTLVSIGIGAIRLSAKRGKRNALYPVKDDSLARWTWFASSGSFATFFAASLFGVWCFVLPTISLPIATVIVGSLLNAIFLTSVSLAVFRIAPPCYRHGALGSVFLIGLMFLSIMTFARIENEPWETVGPLVMVTPASWVAYMFFEFYAGSIPTACLLLIAVFATIVFGLRAFKKLTSMYPAMNYYEQMVEAKLQAIENRQRARQHAKWLSSKK